MSFYFAVHFAMVHVTVRGAKLPAWHLSKPKSMVFASQGNNRGYLGNILLMEKLSCTTWDV